MTLLGPSFLKKYYEIAIRYPKKIGVVKEIDSNKVIGFAIGFINPYEFYNELRKNRIKLLKMSFFYLIMRPWLWKRVMASYLFAKSDYYEAKSSDAIAELASIAILPEYKGRGIGKELLENFILKARENNIKLITLTTDAENNEGVNLFYRKNGFELSRVFEKSKGRVVNEYIYYIR